MMCEGRILHSTGVSYCTIFIIFYRFEICAKLNALRHCLLQYCTTPCLITRKGDHGCLCYQIPPLLISIARTHTPADVLNQLTVSSQQAPSPSPSLCPFPPRSPSLHSTVVSHGMNPCTSCLLFYSGKRRYAESNEGNL